MELTVLEDRSTPSTTFLFDPDVPWDYRGAVETGGRSVFNRVAGDFRIPVHVRADPTGALARASPETGVWINPGVIWHTGVTPVGLDPLESDMVSVVGHELFHYLGFPTHLPDGFASLTYRFATGPILGPTLLKGIRYVPTEADFGALRSLGYAVTPRSYLEFQILSVADPAGTVRQYLVGPSGVLPLGSTGKHHVLITDVDYDGVPDLLVRPAGTGVAYAVSVTGVLLAVAPDFGTGVVLERY